jgi:hypothetical protein
MRHARAPAKRARDIKRDSSDVMLFGLLAMPRSVWFYSQKICKRIVPAHLKMRAACRVFSATNLKEKMGVRD